MNIKQNSSWFNKGLVVFAWLIILGGIGMGVKYYYFTEQYETTNNAQVDQYITPVASKVSGFIREVRFEENQYVRKGDTLVILDNKEFVNQLAVAQSDLQAVEDHIVVNQQSVQTTESAIAIQKARIDAAKIQVWKTEQDYNRFKNLLAENAATLQQFEQMKAAYDAAQAQLRTIEEEQKAARLTTREQVAKIAPTRSSKKQKEAIRENASIYLSYNIVTAPYDGWVGRKNIQAGQLVKEGQTLVNVVSEEKWITANFKETQIAPLEVGGKVIVRADAYPNIEFKGTITSFSPASGSRFSMLPMDNSTGNFVKIEQRIPMRISFDPGQELKLLRAGMNVIVNAEKNQQ
jgi:membrane fusion protein (multidrug efflux system)